MNTVKQSKSSIPGEIGFRAWRFPGGLSRADVETWLVVPAQACESKPVRAD